MNFLYYLCAMKLFHHIAHKLQAAYPEGEARALARWVCEECFGLTQADLLLDKDNQLSADDIAQSEEITERLLRHEPIQYIVGHTTFCGHRFDVGPGALIPRPETEQMVRNILDELPHSTAQGHPLRILDIGTGTGCIAISLALALPGAEVTAWDVSPQALEVARANGRRHAEAHVEFEQCDILRPQPDNRLWDIIVSNPPYIRQSEAARMEHNVLDYEPHLALFVPDTDPLRFYRAIAQFAAGHLNENGQLWLEINEALGKETAHSIEENGPFEAELRIDDFGRPRMLKCKKCVKSASTPRVHNG